MEHGVFLNAEFAKKIKERCIVVRVNFFHDAEFVRRQGVSDTPTVMVFDSKGRRLAL